MPDFFPVSDTQFDVWTTSLVAQLRGEPARFGVSSRDMAPISLALDRFQMALSQAAEAQSKANAAYQKKSSARADLENALKPILQTLNENPAVDSKARVALGIEALTSLRSQASMPTTRPVLFVDASQRLRHIISFHDETSPDLRLKPEDVRGCEFFVKVGGVVPLDLDQCTYLATDTCSPYLHEFTDEHDGKVAHYFGRWINARGEIGPLSIVVSVTVA